MAQQPKKQLPAVRKSTGAANYVDRLAELAQEGVKQEESVMTGSFVSFKGGRISYQGNPVKGDELDVIVVDSIIENAFYLEGYDPDNKQPPSCYSFGRDEEDMSPHEKSSEPQSEKCHDCPQNKFGTAENGKGKACKNVRRLALLPAAPLDAGAVGTAEVAYAKIPVTSVKGWASYVRTLSALEKVPPLAVVTRIGTIPDDKTQFKVTFNKVENLESDVLESVLERVDQIRSDIAFPYQEAAEQEAPASKARTGRTAAKKKF